ncbi:hypothetical protein OHS33_01575 [Streptomyces sp. NBC_00536]|uniref:hypothetical protein n=1 Tax=Streptomyces sp. NBC_00536 TaxID=2975769 RepID=UPI002E80719B|nr:hypothetical protein [Streptomyces sp. NBC_00536]WUC77153.1 hypothetical protein OHS33_01575 [Streptomyces sp. NBC_00536]
MAPADEQPDTGTPERSPAPVPGPGAPFSDRLNYLFDRVRPPGAKEFSNAHVARTISSYGKESCTGAYVGMLRKGERTPTITLVPLFARFFGVEAGYFVEDEVTRKVTDQFELLRKLSEAGVKEIALRSIGLSAKSLGKVLEAIEVVREQEGLPPPGAKDLP